VHVDVVPGAKAIRGPPKATQLLNSTVTDEIESLTSLLKGGGKAPKPKVGPASSVTRPSNHHRGIRFISRVGLEVIVSSLSRHPRGKLFGLNYFFMNPK
jgi:hypothetical protein